MCANQQATAPSAAMISRTPATDALDRPHKRRRSTGSFDSSSLCRTGSSSCSTSSSASFLAGSAAAASSSSSTFDLAAVFASISSASCGLEEEAFPSIGWDDDDDDDNNDNISAHGDCDNGHLPLRDAVTPVSRTSNKRELSGLQRTKACRSLPALPTFRYET